MDAAKFASGFIALIADGGVGDDVFIGIGAADILQGADDDDDDDDGLIGGPGVDTLDGGPGSNIVIED